MSKKDPEVSRNPKERALRENQQTGLDLGIHNNKIGEIFTSATIRISEQSISIRLPALVCIF